MDQSPPNVLRSASLSNVTVSSESINHQPQNFAVVGGHTYRIRRASNDDKSNNFISSPHSLGSNQSLGSATELLNRVKCYEEVSIKQKMEIDLLTNRVRQLETLLRDLKVDEAIIQRPFLFKHFDAEHPSVPKICREKSCTSVETDIASADTISTSCSSSPRQLSKMKSGHFIFSPNSPNYSSSPTLPASDETVLAGGEGEFKSSNTPLLSKTLIVTTDEMSEKTSLHHRLSMTGAERKKASSSVCSSRSKLSLKNKIRTATVPVDPPVLLSTDQLTDPADNIPMSLKKFPWKSQFVGKENGVSLFVAFDNPQMHKSISQFLETSPAHQMHVMLESHENKETARILFGQIKFSGFFSEIEGFPGNLSEKRLRGEVCLVVQEMYGVTGNMKAFPRRCKSNHSDIVELQLVDPAILRDVSSDNSNVFRVRRNEDIVDFFKSCTSRVDVILDPYHDGGYSWYPYFEGTRKMAPQFRSKGIGYLRLGDDMSNYGTAFLSLDAGASFLDNGATNITNEAVSDRQRVLSFDNESVDSASSLLHSSRKDRGLTRTFRRIVSSSREGFGSAAASLEPNELQLQSLASQISELVAGLDPSSSQKWPDKAKHLESFLRSLQLQKNTVSHFVTLSLQASESNAVMVQLLTVFGDLVSKNTLNPKILLQVLKILDFLWNEAEVLLPRPHRLSEDLATIVSFSEETDKVLAKMIRRLLLELTRSLKSNHSVAVSELLQRLLARVFVDASSPAAVLFSLSDLLPDLFPTKTKTPSIPSSFSRVLSFLLRSCQAILSRPDSLFSSLQRTKTGDRCDWSAVFLKSFSSTLNHRDEVIRDLSAQLLAVVLLLRAAEHLSEASKASDFLQSVSEETQRDAGLFLSLLVNEPFSLEESVLEQWRSSSKAIEKIQSGLSRCSADFLRRLSCDASEQEVIEEEKEKASRHSQDRGDLSGRWFETQLLFKTPPSSASDWNRVLQTLRAARISFSSFERLCREFEVSIGHFLRRILPFHEETNSSDQGGSLLSENQLAADDLSPLCSQLTSSRPEKDKDELQREMVEIRRDFVEFRRLVRVKMADEADYRQAKSSLDQITGFLELIQMNLSVASCTGDDIVLFLAELR